jgi:hypothetical protein
MRGKRDEENRDPEARRLRKNEQLRIWRATHQDKVAKHRESQKTRRLERTRYTYLQYLQRWLTKVGKKKSALQYLRDGGYLSSS